MTTAQKRVNWRAIHRILSAVILAFASYFAITGSIVQLIDLRAILSHAPATSPDMMAIRESLDGPSSFTVITPQDFAAPALPESFDIKGAMKIATHAGRTAAHGAALKFIELRVADSLPVVQVMAGEHLLRFDALSGAPLPTPAIDGPAGFAPSSHLSAKRWHRLWVLGDWMLWLNALVGVGLGVMIVTGLVMYVQLLSARTRMGKSAPFWRAGGWWRSLHRWVALAAARFLSVVAVSGTMLSFDSFALQVAKSLHPDQLVHGVVLKGMVGDFSKPLTDQELPLMLAKTLWAYRAAEKDRPIKAVRLRYFSGMPQGVVIAGGRKTEQLVYNADTGERATTSEPGYPAMGFPFGWREHELMKQIHRGDIIGLPGRWMSLFAGCSLIFLAVSGLVMYLNLYWRRRRGGRFSPFWA